MITPQIRQAIEAALKSHQNGNLQQAERQYRQLISQKIYVPVVFTQLALICTLSQRQDEAKKLAQFSLQLKPDFIDGLLRLADIHRFERNFGNAIEFYQRALKQKRDLVIVYAHMAFCFLQLGEFVQARKACLAGLTFEKSHLHTQQLLAQAEMALGNIDEAQALYLEVIKTQPDHVETLYALANLKKAKGDINAAKQLYQKILGLKPSFAQAHFLLSKIHQYSSVDDPQLTQMQAHLDTAQPSDQILYHFAIAKALEDCGQYAHAFEHLNKGNALRFSTFNYDIRTDEAFIGSIINSFSKKSMAQVLANKDFKPNESAKPIFIVGMPRSGTSLVEKILASHSDVYGGGELEHFFGLGTRGFLTQETGFLYKDISTYEIKMFNEIADAYLAKVGDMASNVAHVTDKLPFNMLLIGLIHLVFPKAKIIYCRRNAIDTCLSIYKQNFTTDNYRFAYNLQSLGQFYNLAEKLMAHWQAICPDAFVDIEYEALIANPEQQIRKLVQLCELPWQDECLHFHKSKGVVTTASAYQVRQPIYNSSVELWRRYEKQLTPLLNELQTSKTNLQV